MLEYLRKCKETDREIFRERSQKQAEEIINSKENYSPRTHAIGVEREYYLIDRELNLAKRPEKICEESGCQYELGRHNVELASEVIQDFSSFNRFRYKLRDSIESVKEVAKGRTVVRDGFIGVSPESLTTEKYLKLSDNMTDYQTPSNMTSDIYYSMLNADLSDTDDMVIRHPDFEYKREGMMPVSLTASVQPHLQIPDVEQVPEYLSAATRCIGPILSLFTNSPYLPPDMYDTPPNENPETHELRIFLQRELFNNQNRKGMRLPKDVDSFEELVEKISRHKLYMPLLSEDAPDVDWSKGRYEFNHQQRTCWWWVNPRIGKSADKEGKAVRLELRPFPNQPSFQDNMSLLCISLGTIAGIVEKNHPVLDLSWGDAKENLQNAERDGPNSSLKWINSQGDYTTCRHDIIRDVLNIARDGLEVLNMSNKNIETLMTKVEKRSYFSSPSQWKANRYSQYMDEGYTYEESLRKMFSDYVDNMKINKPFHRWDDKESHT